MRIGNASKIFDRQALDTAVFTAEADDDICTSVAHGLSTGDRITVSSADTLPGGLAASTIYKVEVIDADTFYILTPAGVRIDLTTDGTGEHTFAAALISKIINVADADHVVIAIDTEDSFAAKIQFAGSIADDAPDLVAAQAYDNQYEFVESKDLEDSTTLIDGDGGITASGTDIHRMVEINTNHITHLAIVLSSWTAGKITALLSKAIEGQR